MRYCARQVFCIMLILCGGAGTALPQQRTGPMVAAALSVKSAFEEVANLYEAAHPGERVLFNFAASGVLQRQIEGGAPVDVFASASSREMDELDRKGLLAPGTRTAFARNGMVLIVPGGSKLDITGFADLGRDTVRRIVIGNPATVPAGKYADEVLRSFDLVNVVREKLVFAENVRQAVEYTLRGEVDAGIVFATDAMKIPGITVAAAAPSSSHAPALYHAAVTKSAKDAAAARAFLEVLRSPAGRSVLRQRGFVDVP